MLDYLKKKLKRRFLKRTFSEYGYEIKSFTIEEIGEVEYAQWKHPFEESKEITTSNIGFYQSLVKPGALIIDIGAHTGDTTVPMALAVGKTGLVIALEPNPYVYKILSKNAELNTLHTSIHPLCFAATDKDGEFVFNYSDASFCNGGFLTQLKNQRHNHNYQLTVEGKNLQNYLLKHYSERLPDLGLIKIDAEGYDKEILKTIPLLLSTHRPKLIIECYKNLSKAERNELFDIVYKYGYKLFYISDFEKGSNRVPIERYNMSDRKHFNMLAIHSSAS